MPTTDQTALADLQDRLIEDSVFSSGLWTADEVLRYYNQRQARFLKETLLVAAVAVIGWPPGEPEQPLPQDWIASLSALWHDLQGNSWTPLPKTDAWELDHLGIGLTVGTPAGMRDGDTPGTLQLILGPPPQAQGEVELLYVAQPELVDGTGILFTIPDDWVPYLNYGVMADMLSKDGRGQDLIRARYCGLRYEEGITLARSLWEGWA